MDIIELSNLPVATVLEILNDYEDLLDKMQENEPAKLREYICQTTN